MSQNNRKYKRITVKEELVALTGDAFQAVLLDRMIELTYEAERFDRLIIAEQARAESIGERISMPLMEGWFFKKAEELAEEVLIIDSAKTVRKKLTELVDKGYVLEKNSEAYRFERTKLYKVDLKKLLDEFERLGIEPGKLIGI